MTGSAVVGDGHIEKCLTWRHKFFGVGAQGMATGDVHVVEEIAPHEFVFAGAVAQPGKPVAANFKRWGVGVVKRAQVQLGRLGNALAKLSGHEPAAAPPAQKLSHGVVVGVVVGAGEQKQLALALEHDGVGTQLRLGFGDALELLAKLRRQRQRGLANHQHGPGTAQRLASGLVAVGQGRSGVAEALDVVHQILRGPLFPWACVGRDNDRGAGVAIGGNDQVCRSGMHGHDQKANCQSDESAQLRGHVATTPDITT